MLITAAAAGSLWLVGALEACQDGRHGGAVANGTEWLTLFEMYGRVACISVGATLLCAEGGLCPCAAPADTVNMDWRVPVCRCPPPARPRQHVCVCGALGRWWWGAPCVLARAAPVV